MSTLSPDHARLLLEVEKVAGEAGGEAFVEAMIILFRTSLASLGGKEILADMDDLLGPHMEMYRLIGYVDGLLEIAGKVERIAKGYRDHGEHEISTSFARFGVKLLEQARLKSIPVAVQAAEKRAGNERKN